MFASHMCGFSYVADILSSSSQLMLFEFYEARHDKNDAQRLIKAS